MKHLQAMSREHACAVRHANSLRKEHQLGNIGDAVGVATDVVALLGDAYAFVMQALDDAKGGSET